MVLFSASFVKEGERGWQGGREGGSRHLRYCCGGNSGSLGEGRRKEGRKAQGRL